MKSMKSFLLGGVSALGVLAGATALSAGPDPRADETPPPPAFDAKTSFVDTCAKCHGEDGKGLTKMGDKIRGNGKTMPDLTVSKVDPAKFVGIITNGVPDTAMKAYDKKFTAEQIAALAGYSKTFKH